MPRRMPAAAHALVGLALFASAVVAGFHWVISPPRALILWALVVLGGLVWWWWARSASTLAALALIPLATAIFLATDVMLGFPILIVAMCVARLQFGRRGLVVLGALTLLSGLALMLIADSPVGAGLVNILAVAVFLGLGSCVAELLAGLQTAHRAELALARKNRDAALRELDRALAAERLDLARAMHDDLGQQLTLVRMQLEIAQRTRGHDADAAWEEVAAAREAASVTLTTMRRQVRALAAAPGEERPLAEALDALVDSFSGTGLRVDVQRSGPMEQVDALAYRIIQEGLTNVVRHSRSNEIRVAIDVADEIRVTVADKGPSTAKPAEGFGLRELRRRVEAAGGQLTVNGGSAGFTLAAAYPLQGVGA